MPVFFKRVVKAGMSAFWRNGLLSLATITIVAITLFFIASFYLFGAIASQVLNGLEDKIDISVYFKVETPEQAILELRDELKKLPEVKSVEYVSREENLSNFRAEQIKNDVISQSLEELGENPLPAILNIKAQDPSLYSAVSSYIDSSKYKPFIDEINYFKKRQAIDELVNIFKMIRKTGLGLGIVFLLLSTLVAYNAVRLAIYNFRGEISIMRLVGAGNWFIRGPFLVQGIVYGFFGALISFLTLAFLIIGSSPKFANLLPGDNLWFYFKANLLEIILINFIFGIVLGLFSSLISIRKYLKI